MKWAYYLKKLLIAVDLQAWKDLAKIAKRLFVRKGK